MKRKILLGKSGIYSIKKHYASYEILYYLMISIENINYGERGLNEKEFIRGVLTVHFVCMR